MKIITKKKNSFVDMPSSRDAAKIFKAKISALKLSSYHKIKMRLYETSGLVITENTLKKWMNDPYYMNIYELSAFTKMLNENSISEMFVMKLSN